MHAFHNCHATGTDKHVQEISTAGQQPILCCYISSSLHFLVQLVWHQAVSEEELSGMEILGGEAGAGDYF